MLSGVGHEKSFKTSGPNEHISIQTFTIYAVNNNGDGQAVPWSFG